MNIDSYQYNLLARNPVISQDFVSGLTNGHREPPNNLDLNYTQVRSLKEILKQTSTTLILYFKRLPNCSRRLRITIFEN